MGRRIEEEEEGIGDLLWWSKKSKNHTKVGDETDTCHACRSGPLNHFVSVNTSLFTFFPNIINN